MPEDGHSVELKKVTGWDGVELMVNGEKVFNCNIKDLDYGKIV